MTDTPPCRGEAGFPALNAAAGDTPPAGGQVDRIGPEGTLVAADSPDAHRAIDDFVFRVRREIGTTAEVMGGIDALAFCGSIGENSLTVRRRICERPGGMGIEIEHGRNADGASVICSEFARTPVMAAPTRADLTIARAARAAVGGPARAAA